MSRLIDLDGTIQDLNRQIAYVLHCKDCQYGFVANNGKMYCDLIDAAVLPEDYCSFGDRIVKEADDDGQTD